MKEDRPLLLENRNYSLREDKQLLVITHLSQLICLVTGFGCLLVPLIIWATQKDRVYKMDEHGKDIVNFQLSLIVYAILSIPLILLLGLGLLGLLVVAVLAVIFPVINAIKASNGEDPHYPMSIKFIN